MLPTEMLMIKTACRTKGIYELFRGTAWMLALSFLLGGFMLFLKGKLPFFEIYKDSAAMLAGLGALGYAMIRKGICICKERSKSYCCQVSLRTDQGAACIEALIDTGNGLREPVSNRPVAILDEEVWVNMKMWMRPEKYKLIPYHSLGKANGLLEAYEVDSICVRGNGEEKQYEKVIIALYKGKVSGKGRYHMILPPELSI